MKMMDAATDKKTSGGEKTYPGISLTGNFVIYLIIFIAALIFTQALRSTASNIFFGFIFFLPWVMLVYSLAAKSAIKVYLLSDSATIQKLDPYKYQLRVINESVLPYPFIDAKLMLPQANSVRCIERSVRIAMPPLSSYTVKNTVKFRFRGTYEIGVKYIYIYDFFRMIRIRSDVTLYDTVSVLPRRLFMKGGETSAVSDSAKETKKDPYSYEKIEISDIREYRSGDPLKSIHWNLSSKSEEFMVRDYDTGASKKTYIYCDMSARFPAEPPLKPSAEELKQKGKKKEKKTNGETAADERIKKRKKAAKTALQNSMAVETENAPAQRKSEPDVNELADDRFYDDMNEYCADGVVELAVAVVLRELRDNNECTLFWFDRRSESGVYSFTLRGIEDFNAVFRLFATAPLCPAEDNVTRLSAMVGDTQDVKQLYVTSAIDADAVREFCSMPSAAAGTSFGSSGIILYNPEERFAHVSERKLYIEGCRAQLASKGLKLAEGRID
jgi:hypothetical protein